MPTDSLGLRAVRRALNELSDRAELWIGDLEELPFDRGKVTKLRRVIAHRRRRLGQ